MVRAKHELPGYQAIIKIAEDCIRRFEKQRRPTKADKIRLAHELNSLFLAIELSKIPEQDWNILINRCRNILSRVPAEVQAKEAARVLKELQRAKRTEHVIDTVQTVYERVRDRVLGR